VLCAADPEHHHDADVPKRVAKLLGADCGADPVRPDQHAAPQASLARRSAARSAAARSAAARSAAAVARGGALQGWLQVHLDATRHLNVRLEPQAPPDGARRELLVQHAAQLVPRDAKISRLARLAAKGDAKVAEDGAARGKHPVPVGGTRLIDGTHPL